MTTPLVPGFKVGMAGDLIYSDSGDYDTQSWNIVKKAKDVNVALENGEVELNSRDSVFELSGLALKKLGIEWDMIWYSGNAFARYLLAAMWNGTIVDFATLDGKLVTPGSTGFRVVGYIFSANGSQKLVDGQTYSFSVKPTMTEPQIDPTPVISDGTSLSLWDFSAPS
jgi:hypothetical protein